MGVIVSDRQLMNCTAQTTPITADMQFDEADTLSIGIHIAECSGSNLLDFEESVDGINYVPVVSLTITNPGTTIWHAAPLFSLHKRISYVPGTGSATFTVHINVRNNHGYEDNNPLVVMS